MLAMIRFSIRDMLRHYKPWLAMAALVAATNLIYLGLGGYRTALQQAFGKMPYDDLVVQESNTTGEFFGSRLSPEIGDKLTAMRISRVIPEIHDYTGTSISNITILRGIDLERYQLVNSFKIRSGRALKPGDAWRTAMIGWRLAARLSLSPGKEITLRGRQFLVLGIFQTGTYVDNECLDLIRRCPGIIGLRERCLNLYHCRRGDSESGGHLARKCFDRQTRSGSTNYEKPVSASLQDH